MNTEGLMIFQEQNQEEFDFNSLVGRNDYFTITNIPVKIDRIIRDVTQTTVLGISGTMVIRGTKVRAFWDTLGNIIECKKILSLWSPKTLTENINSLFSGTTADMFRLVNIQKAE